MKIFLILIFTKVTNTIIKKLKLGSGYTFSGYVVLELFPDILKENIFKYKKGIILVTGTNGKTTTSKLIANVLQDNNLKVVHNSSGSNLLRGIVTTLINDLNFFLKPKSDIAVLEVDEMNLPILLKYLTPKAIVLLNLSRDQLDRYGEIDNIIISWKHSFEKLNKKTNLIINSTQPLLSDLKLSTKATILEYNDILLKGLYTDDSFNISNINACIKVCEILKIKFSNYKDAINNFESAYGRGEVLKVDKTQFKIYLTKNPNSFNSNLLSLNNYKKIDSVIFILNDNEPDGYDVSWIYDIDNFLLTEFKNNHNLLKENIYVTGSRAYDFALRLKLLGYQLDLENIFTDISKLKDKIDTGKEQFSVVLPNYSAMLSFRKLYLGRDIL